MKKLVTITNYITVEISDDDIEEVLNDGKMMGIRNIDDAFIRCAKTVLFGSTFAEGIGEENQDYTIIDTDEDYETDDAD